MHSSFFGYPLIAQSQGNKSLSEKIKKVLDDLYFPKQCLNKAVQVNGMISDQFLISSLHIIGISSSFIEGLRNSEALRIIPASRSTIL